jgi:hypothetical protein
VNRSGFQSSFHRAETVFSLMNRFLGRFLFVEAIFCMLEWISGDLFLRVLVKFGVLCVDFQYAAFGF